MSLWTVYLFSDVVILGNIHVKSMHKSISISENAVKL